MTTSLLENAVILETIKKEGTLLWRLPSLPSFTATRHVCLGGALARPCTILVEELIRIGPYRRHCQPCPPPRVWTAIGAGTTPVFVCLRDDWRYMAGDLSCARLRSSRVTKSRVTKSRVVRRKVDRFCVALPRNFPLSRHIARFHSGALRFRSCRMESRIAPSSSRHNLRECAGGGITWGCGML